MPETRIISPNLAIADDHRMLHNRAFNTLATGDSISVERTSSLEDGHSAMPGERWRPPQSGNGTDGAHDDRTAMLAMMRWSGTRL